MSIVVDDVFPEAQNRIASATRAAEFPGHIRPGNALGGVYVNGEIQNQALHRAAELLGDPDKLAQRLGVPQSYLRVWLNGKPVPASVFLRTIDIITDHEVEAVKAAAASQRRQA